jgi:hypothetical protein
MAKYFFHKAISLIDRQSTWLTDWQQEILLINLSHIKKYLVLYLIGLRWSLWQIDLVLIQPVTCDLNMLIQLNCYKEMIS